MRSPLHGSKEELALNSPFGLPGSTPQRMNCIVEEDTSKGPPFRETEAVSTPPRPLSFYSNRDGNNSSGSLIYNQGFSFGENAGASGQIENKRHSLKYIPGPKLPPVSSSRNRSPIRPNRSPSPDRSRRPSSGILDAPFNFSSSSLQPPASAGSASRASFRKGHRYKHSSVSMNFFQEPDVKVPLNIAKSLPIPDLADLKANIPWPRGYVQLIIVTLQCITCIATFQTGHVRGWNNLITLSHFVLYDILGSVAIILVENLSQFEVWNTGTITFPFGLNRIDVLLSFALAVSLCFMGLDLFFHILEETVVLFVESSHYEQHDEIAPNIPHTHHSGAMMEGTNDIYIWYILLSSNLLLSLKCFFDIFHSNAHTKFKTKNPIITCVYVVYLMVYPFIQQIATISDYLATGLLSIFIISYGWTIAKWTATVLLLGFSTTSVTGLMLDDNNEDSSDTKQPHVLRRSKSTLPTAIVLDQKAGNEEKSSSEYDSTIIKSKILENIEALPLFRANCKISNDNLIIAKVNFDKYIVLMKLSMSGGSNDDEKDLLLAIDKCIKKTLPTSETTVEIDRL